MSILFQRKIIHLENKKCYNVNNYICIKKTNNRISIAIPDLKEKICKMIPAKVLMPAGSKVAAYCRSNLHCLTFADRDLVASVRGEICFR